VTDSAPPPPRLSVRTADFISGGLFLGFVTLLFLGYLYATFPYSSLAAIPLFGSLITLFWANLTADRALRSTAKPLNS